MKVNLQKRKKCLHPKFLTLTGERECIDFFNEHTVSNFLNEVGTDFISLPHIKKYALTLSDPKDVKDKPKLLIKLKNYLIKLDSLISKKDPNDLTPKDFLPYLKLLTHHTHYNRGIEWISRYGSNPIRNNSLHSWLEQSIKDINLINHYSDDPETGGLDLNSWNHILSSGWMSIMAGWDDVAFYLFSSLEKLIYKQRKTPPTNIVFKNVLGHPHVHSRFLMSLYKGLGKIAELRGDKDMEMDYYRKIIEFFPDGEKDLKITWYTGINRVIESNIQLYLLEPTKERKQQILNQFIECRSLNQSIDAYETVTESCLVAFMIYKHVLKGNLDEIKFR